MGLLSLVVAAVGCVVIAQPVGPCVDASLHNPAAIAGSTVTVPTLTGPAIDVALTADAAYAWDVTTGEVLYEKEPHEERPVASLSKLLTALTVRSRLQADDVVEIPQAARRAQLLGANARLPVGEHVSVDELLEASMVASANDAAVTLAVAVSGDEETFVEVANTYAREIGLENTQLANATGFSGGEQFSTAHDVSLMLQMAYEDLLLRPFLSQASGILVTEEGSRRQYKTTNKLLGSYVTVLAAKTGFTRQAGENLALISGGREGQAMGAVILGSDQRFQDMKILIEWMERNVTWPEVRDGIN